MAAKIESNYDKNRNKLSEVIPLSSPYTVLLEATRTCNFRCYYCIHSTKGIPNGEYEKSKLSVTHMPFELFESISRQICEMVPQPKRVLFVGLGEPLMYPYLADAIKCLRKDGFVGRIDINTNASLMDKKMADKLIASGVSRIIVSLQGMDAEKYEEVCSHKIDYNQYVENLRYLYENKGDIHIFIKIMDNMFRSEEERERFLEVFGAISDTCNIEHLVVSQVQMGDHGGKADHLLNVHSDEILPMEVCTKPFYQIQIYPDGDVLACPVSGAEKVFAIGNVYEETLEEIWNGQKRRVMLERFLNCKRKAYAPCEICEGIYCIARPEEIIDDCVDEIKERLDRYYGIRN